MKKSFLYSSILLLTCTIFCLICMHALAQTAVADNKLYPSYTQRNIPSSSNDITGVFQGRPPCAFAAQWQLPVDADCEKVKIELVLYKNAVTGQPANYKISFVGAGDTVHRYGGVYRWKEIMGSWTIIKGMPDHSGASICQLDQEGKKVYLWKADNNILFILDAQKKPMAGNIDFSYTLNRVVPTPAPK